MGSRDPELPGSLQVLPVKVTAGKVRLEDKQRLEQEQQSEEKRLAIMMMKKREKYLYKKIMFGKKRKIREVRREGAPPASWDGLFPNPLAPSTLPVPGKVLRSLLVSPGCPRAGQSSCGHPCMAHPSSRSCGLHPPRAVGALGGPGLCSPCPALTGALGVSPQANKLAEKRKAHDAALKEQKKKSKKARQA